MNSDSEPELSAETLQILQQVMREQQEQQERFEQLRQQALKDKAEEEAITMDVFREDWQLSQFWYDDETSETLAREILDNTNAESIVCCISSPTVYVKLMSLDPPGKNNMFLFEFDTRFEVYGRQFVHYDYLTPSEFRLAQELKGTVDLVVVDPPFLNEDCLTRTLETVKFLLKEGGKIVLSTGLVMAPIAKAAGLELTTFMPSHQNGLWNDFRCYVNYKPSRFTLKA